MEEGLPPPPERQEYQHKREDEEGEYEGLVLWRLEQKEGGEGKKGNQG